MDPRIADDPVYGPQLRDSFAALPILSLSGGDGIWQLYADPQARRRILRAAGPFSSRASLDLPNRHRLTCPRWGCGPSASKTCARGA